MFRTVAIWLVVLTAASMGVHFLLSLIIRRGPARGPRVIKRYSFWERLVHVGLLVSFLVLVATGFYAAVCKGTAMTGYGLMLHMVFGGVFAGSLAAAAVTWAHDHRFVRGDGTNLKSLGGYWTGRTGLPAGRFDAVQKAQFWFTLVAGLVVIAGPLLAMTQWFGTEGQRVLMEIHRWASLLLAIGVFKHAYLTLLANRGAFGVMLSGKVSREWAEHYHPDWKPTDIDRG